MIDGDCDSIIAISTNQDMQDATCNCEVKRNSIFCSIDILSRENEDNAILVKTKDKVSTKYSTILTKGIEEVLCNNLIIQSTKKDRNCLFSAFSTKSCDNKNKNHLLVRLKFTIVYIEIKMNSLLLQRAKSTLA